MAGLQTWGGRPGEARCHEAESSYGAHRAVRVVLSPQGPLRSGLGGGSCVGRTLDPELKPPPPPSCFSSLVW